MYVDFQKHLRIFKFNCHCCFKEGRRMGFATKKRLFRHMGYAHPVDPEVEFNNEANAELIFNPPPFEETATEKTRRGRIKGRKNKLKLDPDTGQLVKLLPSKKKKDGSSPRKPRGRPPKERASIHDSVTAPPPSSLWTMATWPHNFNP